MQHNNSCLYSNLLKFVRLVLILLGKIVQSYVWFYLKCSSTLSMRVPYCTRTVFTSFDSNEKKKKRKIQVNLSTFNRQWNRRQLLANKSNGMLTKAKFNGMLTKAIASMQRILVETLCLFWFIWISFVMNWKQHSIPNKNENHIKEKIIGTQKKWY